MIGSIIEFKHKEGTLVDRICGVCFNQNGKLEYWTELYGECPGSIPGITTDRVVRFVEESEYALPEIPPFQFKKGDKVRFEWDGKTIEDVITTAYYFVNDHPGENEFRYEAGEYDLCDGEGVVKVEP